MHVSFSFLCSLVVQQRPFPPGVLYYTPIISTTASSATSISFLFFRYLIKRLFSCPLREWRFTLSKVDEGIPKFRSRLSDHVAAGTPGASAQPSLYACCAGADFVHKIGTRPPLFTLFTKLLVRSLSLRPGLLRRTLTGYIVESLSTARFSPFGPTPRYMVYKVLP